MNENKIREIVAESVKKVLKESSEMDYYMSLVKKAQAAGLYEKSQEELDEIVGRLGINPKDGGPFKPWQVERLCGTNYMSRAGVVANMRAYNKRYGKNGPVEKFVQQSMQQTVAEGVNEIMGYRRRPMTDAEKQTEAEYFKKKQERYDNGKNIFKQLRDQEQTIEILNQRLTNVEDFLKSGGNMGFSDQYERFLGDKYR